jgi:hypothetical protein
MDMDQGLPERRMDPMNPINTHVSVIDPINPAVERVKLLLFAPFDLGRWFIIGFCAWLAQLGRWNGGGGGEGRGNGTRDFASGFREAKDAFAAHYAVIIPVGIIIAVLVIGIALLLTWLSSRGRFMFLDCVARNKAHVREPWYRFRNHAASLFAFRVVVGFITVAIMLAIVVAGTILSVATHASGFSAAAIVALISLGLLLAIVIILFLIIRLFTKDFIVPIMYLHAVSCTQAWRMLLDVTSWNQGRFILYVLFRIALWMVITAFVTGIGCMTCCVAFCIFAIPYLGTVALLPIRIFERAYSAYYLSQYGPQFNVFAPPAPAPAAA